MERFRPAPHALRVRHRIATRSVRPERSPCRAAMLALTRAALLVGLAVLAASCGTNGCTEVACRSGVYVDISRIEAALPEARTVTVCIEDRCRRSTTGSDVAEIGERSQSSAGPVRVRVVIRDRRGSVIKRLSREVELTRSQPNGPDCSPVCWLAAFRVASDGRIFRTA